MRASSAKQQVSPEGCLPYLHKKDVRHKVFTLATRPLLAAGFSDKITKGDVNALTIDSPGYKKYYRDACKELSFECCSAIAEAMLLDSKTRLRQRLNYCKIREDKKLKAKLRSRTKRAVKRKKRVTLLALRAGSGSGSARYYAPKFGGMGAKTWTCTD